MYGNIFYGIIGMPQVIIAPYGGVRSISACHDVAYEAAEQLSFVGDIKLVVKYADGDFFMLPTLMPRVSEIPRLEYPSRINFTI